MKNSINKTLFISLIIFIVFSIFSNVLASDLKTSLDIIQKASETKYLENDQGYISKTIVDSNANTGEVTIELKLSNTKKETEQVTYDSTELVFVVDNSFSMEEIVSENKTRRDIVIESAKDFTSNLFKDVSNLKVGLVYYYGWDSEDEGQTSLQTYGTIDTAKILSNLTSNESDIQNALTSLSSKGYNYGTNTDAGLQRAKSMFSSSKTAQKFIILLSDGVPNHAVGESIATGGLFNPSAATHTKNVNAKTKATMQSISSSNINLITLLTGLKDLSEDETEILETVFGTTENPTVGSLYNIADTDISKIIKEKIYVEVLEKVQNPINSTKIIDYFPKDITDNFEFSYVGNPSIGTVSDSIDNQTNTIEWNIGTLKGDEIATLKYKLKIKDMKNEQLLNKTIATNEKVVLTYKDTDSNDYTVTLSSSPKIQLSEVKEELTATISYDPTTETTRTVKATIKTNKKVNAVDGWTLSEDGKTLSKTYSTNTTETVHLVDLDNMTKDVLVTINNIKSANSDNDNNKDDTTIATGKLPQAGVSITIIFIILLIVVFSIITYKKYNSYKDIK